MIFNKYLDDLHKVSQHGDAREESYYPALKTLIESYSEENGKASVNVTVLPKKTDAGNPDFRIWDGNNHIIGYIEAKDPSVENLDRIEETEQLKRYRSTFPNVILTNFYEFRLFRNGILVDTVLAGRQFISKRLKTTPPLENQKKFDALLSKFTSFLLPAISNAEDLAKELAKRTRFLRDEVIAIEMALGTKKERDNLRGFYNAFKKYLLLSLTEEQFADLYSQTITYGLFAARSRASATFNREAAFNYIPPTIGILRDVFRFISLGEPPKSLQVMVDDIAEVLDVTDVKKILHDYYSKGRGSDPIVHFYETFLAEYNPTVRERRGVYYTPEAVVSYIARALNDILKTHFGCTDGFASKEVTLLDPSAGTLTFPAHAIRIAVSEYVSKYGSGGLQRFVRTNLLNRFFAFELMMAPYAIGHLKIGFLLDELGCPLAEDDRFNLYLTNTLEMEEIDQQDIPGFSSLSEESRKAGQIKKNEPILVILGNPPYSGVSANINEWTEQLLKEDIDGAQSYYKVDNEPLGERKLWLQDDYVKFLRFAQWKIQKAGAGIVGMITNHSYLDNPTFRGMRQSLMKTFDQIYILDLHGNSLKKETAPDGSKDENVFDIRQGVAIALFVKLPKSSRSKIAHLDLFGLREDKYRWLDKNSFMPKKFNTLVPEKPWYFFVPRNTAGIKQFLDWPSVTDIFPTANVGIVTARDHFAVDMNCDSLRNRIRQFRDLRVDDDLIRGGFGLKDTSTFKLTKFRKALSNVKDWDSCLIEYTYRPFDTRHIYYSKWVVERPIYDTMRHMLQPNIGLTIGRQGQVVGDSELWNLVFITDKPIDFNLFYRGGELLFPLYLYPNGDMPSVFDHPKGERKPNISDALLSKLKHFYKTVPTPECILAYVYCVLHSPLYREKYHEFLRIDFPRIPFPTKFSVFTSMAEIGDKLMNLHLLKERPERITVKFQGKGGDDAISRITFEENTNRLFINETKYFDGITPDVWGFNIGGYQVLLKYLKDRKGKNMENPSHFCLVASTISETIAIQKKIDAKFPVVDRSPISFV